MRSIEHNTITSDKKYKKMEKTKEWITVNEALSALQITSRTTLYKYLNKYNIRASKPLGKVYINYNDIVTAIANKAVVMGL